MKARLAVTALAAVVALTGRFSASAQERPDVSGSWTLNADLTARARAQEIASEPNIGRRLPIGGSGGPVGMGGGGRGPTDVSSGRRHSDETAKAREGVRIASLVPERLTIVRDGETLVVTDPTGVSARLTPGKSTKSEIGALTVDTKTRWDGVTLVVDRKFEGGVKATDRYSMTANPRRLLIVSKIENTAALGERARTLHRVYDALE
jgi:antitoxin (DNA-binding transcriptional repressor) of toxin-antitoxin stability system